jgi:antirestriction protein ArdC
MKRDDAKQLVTDGLAELNQALASGRSETLKRYLTVLGRFHRYSFGNVMLILTQRENATHVAGFHKWRELGRHVRKGEKGIAIFAPCRYRRNVEDDNDEDGEVHDIRGFKVVHVWDVSQTEGKELPEFAKVHGEAGENLARLERVIRDAGVTLEYGPLPLGADGACSPQKITVRPELSDSEKFAVLAHEHGHFLLHQQNGRKHECSKTVRETEAEAVAFVVCHAIGLDSATRSADYIQLYRGDTETLAESLELIQKTAADIVQAIEDVRSSVEVPFQWAGATEYSAEPQPKGFS